jgi:hypothetical protein
VENGRGQNGLRHEGTSFEHKGRMSKRNRSSCNDCYFRQAGLCALPGEEVCPTFRRAAAAAKLDPPPQARLVPRMNAPLASHPVTAYA